MAYNPHNPPAYPPTQGYPPPQGYPPQYGQNYGPPPPQTIHEHHTVYHHGQPQPTTV